MSTLDKWKLVFGFTLLLIVAVLALSIALGKVEEKTSYGLLPVLTMLGVLVGNFANWAFGHHYQNGKGIDKDQGKGVGTSTEESNHGEDDGSRSQG